MTSLSVTSAHGNQSSQRALIALSRWM